jgi:hypothetical protein
VNDTSTAVAVRDEAAAEARRQAARQSLVAGNTPRAIVPTDFDGAWRISQAVVAANMAPKSLETVEKCAVAILHGLEVGLTPMQALQSIAVINGRPSLWGDGALGLIQASGHLDDQDEHFEGTDESADSFKAVCILKRKGKSRPYRGEFSITDAKQAKLLGKDGPWQTYRKRMLKMRARAFAMRDGFSDVLKGLSVAEEQQDVERVAGEDHAPRRRVPSPPPEVATETAAATEPVVETEDVIDEYTGEVLGTVPKKPKADPEPGHGDMMDHGGFPGDKPMVKHGHHPDPKEADLDIPYMLDAKLTDPEKDWLKACDESFKDCTDTESLISEQQSVMMPSKDAVSERAWQHATTITKKHLARIQDDG